MPAGMVKSLKPSTMKIEHELFAHYYLTTGDKYYAYKRAYPQSSGEALKRAARRLVNHPCVREFIFNEVVKTDAELQRLLEEQKTENTARSVFAENRQ